MHITPLYDRSTAITHLQTVKGRDKFAGAKYEVELRQLGDPRSRLQSEPVPSPPDGFLLRQSVDSVKFAFVIQPKDRRQDENSKLHFRLIFDRNVPLWRREFVDSPLVPRARAEGETVRTLGPQGPVQHLQQ